MHGLVFAGLRDYSVEALGAVRADELWADRVFSVTESYEDEWFTAQLDRLAAATGQSRASVDRDFGVFAARTTFAGLYPEYYAEADDVFDFLLGIEEKIHELVRATIPGASPPRLHVQQLGEGEGVLISYTSAPPPLQAARGAGAGRGRRARPRRRDRRGPVHAAGRPWLRLHRASVGPWLSLPRR